MKDIRHTTWHYVDVNDTNKSIWGRIWHSEDVLVFSFSVTFSLFVLWGSFCMIRYGIANNDGYVCLTSFQSAINLRMGGYNLAGFSVIMIY